MPPRFSPGRNIAIKVPPHLHAATVGLYRDVLGLEHIPGHLPAVVFDFGSKRVWIDNVPAMSQAETWLEVVTSDINAAAEHLANAGVVRCNDIEPLPEGWRAFWISSPASIIHLVCEVPEERKGDR
ncbi:MAG: hypothetical protein M3Q11_03635 [Pseudomonadota bacterium]|nr:hypothetical protein [Pseudomonadota bacterium]